MWGDAREHAGVDPFDLSGQVAVITGGGTGIGRAISLLLARHGATVVLASRSAAHLDRGLTFATNGDRGVCIKFHRSVRGIAPLGLLRHPALTVTVEDVDGLVARLGGETAEAGGERAG